MHIVANGLSNVLVPWMAATDIAALVASLTGLIAGVIIVRHGLPGQQPQDQPEAPEAEAPLHPTPIEANFLPGTAMIFQSSLRRNTIVINLLAWTVQGALEEPQAD